MGKGKLTGIRWGRIVPIGSRQHQSGSMHGGAPPEMVIHGGPSSVAQKSTLFRGVDTHQIRAIIVVKEKHNEQTRTTTNV